MVPNLCRQAIEHTLTVRHRTASAGEGLTHEQTELLLESAKGLTQLAALALLRDTGRTGDVLRHLNSRYGPKAADTFQNANKLGHVGAAPGAAIDALVSDVRWLIGQLQ